MTSQYRQRQSGASATSAIGTFRTCQVWLTMPVVEGKADFPVAHSDF